MSRPSTPHIKLSEVKRKPLVPGPNSWAQEVEKASSMKGSVSGTATNRSKYEDKPMPPIPQDRDMSPPPIGPGKPGYIQPATPLTYSSPTSAKNRAVTDPVASKHLFATGKGSIADLRDKFSSLGTHTNRDVDTKDTVLRNQAPIPRTAELQTQPVSGRNIIETRRETPPSSAPANTGVPNPYLSPEIVGRQTNSTPVPTRRYLRENNIPIPILTQTSFSIPQVTYSDVDQASQEKNKPEGIIVGDGRLNPTRSGTYGTVGEVEYVEGKAIHRVASFTGVIENAEPPPRASEQQQHPRSTSTSPSRVSSFQDHTMLPSVAYSPSVYGGIWENDPHVGHTLPPFSPMPPRFPEFSENVRTRSHKLQETVPLQNEGTHGPTRHFGDYAPSYQSSNSWAPMHRESDTLFDAAVPPLFSNGSANNSVPPPPHTCRDYQPTLRPVPPELHMLELNIHHHIDTCFGRLSRLVTDKIDHCSDQLLREFENAEKRSEKSLKSVKGDISIMQNDIHALQNDICRSQECSERVEESLLGLQGHVDKVGSKLEKIDEELGKLSAATTSASAKSENREKTVTAVEYKLRELIGKIERLVEHTASEHQGDGNSPRRRQSTSQPSPAFYAQRQQFHSGASNPSVGPRNSNTSSHGRRSNTATGGTASGASDGRSSRREYYADMGNSMGEAPDLRQHPAFVSPQQNHGFDANGHPLGVASDGTFYQLPSFAGGGPNGWYQQAYGN